MIELTATALRQARLVHGQLAKFIIPELPPQHRAFAEHIMRRAGKDDLFDDAFASDLAALHRPHFDKLDQRSPCTGLADGVPRVIEVYSNSCLHSAHGILALVSTRTETPAPLSESPRDRVHHKGRTTNPRS